MKKAEKMNGLYKAGFILMGVCLAILVASVVFMLVVENLILGTALAAAGVFLCLIGIILTMFSKAKSTAEQCETEESNESSAESADTEETDYGSEAFDEGV